MNTALISPVNPQAQLVAIAENIKTNMTQPFQLSAQTVQISASISIVLYPDHGQDLFALLKNADIAMYQVKTHSRNDFGFFIPPAATP
jgi:diguanylate cyclase (GGDEF)-like protein